MLLVVDENIKCNINENNSNDEFLLVTKDNKDTILNSILERVPVVSPQQVKIPKNISFTASNLAYSLINKCRSVYVSAIDEDCTKAISTLKSEDYIGVFIDGKLFLDKVDGDPQC